MKAGTHTPDVRAFLAWWRDGLAALVPERVMRRVRRPRRHLSIAAREGGFDLHVLREDVDAPVASLALAGNEGARAALAPWLRRHAHAIADVRLAVDPAGALVRTLTMPREAGADLADALRFEIDRQTPFAADAVYFGFRAEPDGAHLQVTLAVVPRARLDPVLAALVPLGLTPGAAQIGDPRAAGIRVALGNDGAGGDGPRRGLRAALLATVAVALLGAAMWLPLELLQARLARTSAPLAELRTQALEARRMREEIDRAAGSLGAISKRRGARTKAIDVLLELTRRLPDTTWVNRLRLRGTELVIEGEAQSSGEIVEILEPSRILRNAAFRAAVQVNPRTQRDRYQLGLTVVGGEP
ncbi:MAG: PilN domain-containing protein [Gammaproteobacteria bacterium]